MRRLRPSQGAVRRGPKNGRGRRQRTKGGVSYTAFAEALMLTKHHAGNDNDATKDLVSYLSHIARLQPTLFLKLWAVIEQSANER
jgi:hypothetical protein